jgi:uncharacterized membrane protein
MPQMSNRWAVVLFTSLAINLFVGGVFVSHWVYHGRDVARSHAFGLRGVSRHMDEETRRTMRRMWSVHEDEMRPLLEAMREARENAVEAIGAELFDKAALEEALAATLATSTASQEAFHAAVVDAAEELTPKQRRSFFAAASRRLHRQPGARRK